MTILEVLVSLAIFSICILGIVQMQKAAIDIARRAEKKDLALVVAEDLYEEMLSVPFEGAPAPAGAQDPPRPKRLGSLLAYDNLVDSPIHDILDQEAPWGRDLARRVSIRRFTPEDRMRALPPLLPPTGEYAECRIEVSDVTSNEILSELRFVRAL